MNIAKMSPRFEDNVLYWYQGNTFELEFIINLKIDDVLTDLKMEDIIEIKFKTSEMCDETIKSFVFTEIVSNTVTMVFDEATSQLFKAGKYVFGVTYVGQSITTLIATNNVVVERAV